MADLVETPQWEPGIYEFTTDDLVEGGPNGIDNVPTRQLANRTAYLKALCESLGLDKQPLDATLTALAALTTDANKLVYATGADKFATADLTAFARTLLDDVDAATMRTTLGAAPLASPGLTGTPTAPTAAPGTNTTQLANTAFVAAAISALVNSSPATLDTLNELANALGNDPNFATTIATSLGNKQPLDATLTALAALTTAADKLIYATGPDTFDITPITALARSILGCSTTADLQLIIPSVPAGITGHFAMSSAPSGWIKANGAAISRTTYAALFSAIGTTFGAGNGTTTFNIPDLRGEFIRCYDDGRGVDSSRVLGSFQESTLLRYWVGDMGQLHHKNNDGYVNQPDAQQYTQDTDNYTTQDYFRIRPRNVALLACIKY